MTWEEKLKLRQLKSKNNKVKSTYLHLCDSNIGRSRALTTFTVSAMRSKPSQLLLVREIKNYFAKRLQNLKIDVQYFSVIELGRNKSNSHLHFQIFYNDENYKSIEKAYKKTINHFTLQPQRCDLLKEDLSIQHTSSFNYVIKEFDNLQLSDQEIWELDEARRKIKKGSAKNIQLYSVSRAKYSRTLYKKLWYSYGLNYLNVNTLMNNYAIRLQGLKLMKARQNVKLPYILFKDGAIQINTVKLYKLILLTLLYIGVFEGVGSRKILYYNKNRYKWQKKEYLYYQLE